MLGWQWQGWNALPGLNWGYAHWTIAQFEKDTGLPTGIATIKDAAGVEWLYVADVGNQRIVKYRIK